MNTKILMITINLKTGEIEIERNVVNKELKYLMKAEYVNRYYEEELVLRFNLTRLAQYLSEASLGGQYSEDEAAEEAVNAVKKAVHVVNSMVDESKLDFITEPTYARLIIDYVMYELGISASHVLNAKEEEEVTNGNLTHAKLRLTIYPSCIVF